MKPSNSAVLLLRLRHVIEASVAPLEAPWPKYTLFFSICDGNSRAKVITVTGVDFAGTWRKGLERLRRIDGAKNATTRWVRVDWIETVEETTWGGLKQNLREVKRNYFRRGISLDRKFSLPFLEMEINANAMLYGGASIGHCAVNTNNFKRYAKIRHNLDTVDFDDDKLIYIFSTRGAFVSSDSDEVHLLHGPGLRAGRRLVEHLTPKHVRDLIWRGSDYLATQVGPEGRFQYGWHPCFDRPIEAYNTLRHASTLYAMIESWEITRDNELGAAIDRALRYLTEELVKPVTLPSGRMAAFLVDVDEEIKLGGNAVAILALVKYTELFASDAYLVMLEQLAAGITFMQNDRTGKFNHVLHYPSLTVKEAFRIIYYDGEAAFGLMRLYGLTNNAEWLTAVEKAFVHFIEAKHWKAHDHWLGYCVNEITRYRPYAKYYRFGIDNVAKYLPFVKYRITTFPTLLELMMASEKMLSRLSNEPELKYLFKEIDLHSFYGALHTRAHHILNGHFWPEMAMFFANPRRINGSFFIRHHAFRVRIDDVEHYLSGLVAYLKYLEESGGPYQVEGLDKVMAER